LYAAGSFTNSGELQTWRIARWSGSGWSALGSGAFNTASAGSIARVVVSGDDVYIAGSFNRAGGKPSLGVGRWNETLTFLPPATIRLVNPLWNNGRFQFDVAGLTSGAFSVHASTNLIDWSRVHTGDAANHHFEDAASSSLRHRVYRVTVP
jgi:hypothetical protein